MRVRKYHSFCVCLLSAAHCSKKKKKIEQQKDENNLPKAKRTLYPSTAKEFISCLLTLSSIHGRMIILELTMYFMCLHMPTNVCMRKTS